MTTVHAQTGIKLATKPAKTSLLGGHFIYKANNTPDAPTPSSANVVEWVDNDPTLWRHNVHIGSSGIKLRYGETTLSKWDTGSLIFYIPTTTNGITTTAKAIELNSTSGIVLYKDGTNKGLQLSSTGLEIFGSSQSTADVTVNSSGINIGNGKITGGTVGTITQYEPDDNFIYLSTHEYGSTLRVGTFFKTNWQLVVGKNFGVTPSGDVYAYNATMTGRIIADRGKIGGTLDDNNGWSILAGRLYTGTIGAVNSLHMRTSDLDSGVSINNCLARTDWRLTVGNKFGVTKDGELFADGANLTNINAGSINIGPVVKYYVCDTVAATPAKTIDNVSNFTLTTGLTINVTFTYGNTSSAPTLNINDTGVISIMAYDGSALDNSYEYNIAAGSSRTFTYNGTCWLLQDNGAGDAYLRAYNAEDNAYGYITTISGIDGISVRRKWDNTNFLNIRDDGVHIYKTINNVKTDVAFYGETARIGQVADGQSRVEIKETGIDFYNRTSGIDIVLAHIGYGQGTQEGGSTSQEDYPYYTFGKRNSDSPSTRGNYSFAAGTNNYASGWCSHAEGATTEASGECSHSEGCGTEASGIYSHAEGEVTKAKDAFCHAEGYYTEASNYSSHAEGYHTKAIGFYSHAEGYYTEANGYYSHAEGYGDSSGSRKTTAHGTASHAEGYNTIANSSYTHAQNLGTIAGYPSQTAIGKYNKNQTDTAFEIGNGSGYAESNRSNAFAVDWNGVARLKGNLFTGCSSDSTGGYEFGRKTDYHIVVGGIHICWGLESITHTGSGYKEVTITLPYTYTSAPRCFASYGNRLTSGAPRTAYATQGGLAGNKIYVASYATAACTAYVNWMTIGV